MAGELSSDDEEGAAGGAGRLTFDPTNAGWDSGDDEGADVKDAHQRGTAFSSKLDAPVSVAVRGKAAAKLLQQTTASRLNVLSDESDDDSDDDAAEHGAAPAASKGKGKQQGQSKQPSASAGNKAAAKKTAGSGGVSKEALAALASDSEDEQEKSSAAGVSGQSAGQSNGTGGANPWLKTAGSTVGLTPQLSVGDKSTREEKRQAKLQRNRNASATAAASEALVSVEARRRGETVNERNPWRTLFRAPYFILLSLSLFLARFLFLYPPSRSHTSGPPSPSHTLTILLVLTATPSPRQTTNCSRRSQTPLLLPYVVPP